MLCNAHDPLPFLGKLLRPKHRTSREPSQRYERPVYTVRLQSGCLWDGPSFCIQVMFTATFWGPILTAHRQISILTTAPTASPGLGNGLPPTAIYSEDVRVMSVCLRMAESLLSKKCDSIANMEVFNCSVPRSKLENQFASLSSGTKFVNDKLVT